MARPAGPAVATGRPTRAAPTEAGRRARRPGVAPGVSSAAATPEGTGALAPAGTAVPALGLPPTAVVVGAATTAEAAAAAVAAGAPGVAEAAARRTAPPRSAPTRRSQGRRRR